MTYYAITDQIPDRFLIENDFLPPVFFENNVTTDGVDNRLESYNSTSYVLCGVPAFCNRELAENEELWKCGKAGTIGIFFTGFLLLALLIISSNLLVIVLTCKHSTMRNRLGYLKLSLALVDLSVGINISCAMSASYATTINMNRKELLNKTFQSVNSPAAVISGGMLIFSFEASILHLLFMSIERFFAIQYPILHRTSRKRWILVILSVVWLLSLVYSFIPAAFPNHFRYSYVPMLFLFEMSSIQSESNTLDVQGPLLFSLAIIIPYLLTIIFTALTGYSARKHVLNFSKIQDSGRMCGLGEQKKPEIEALKVTSLMILTYTVAKVPIMVVYMLFYAEKLNCQNFAIPFTAAFFITISNSFLNVAVYSFRDRNFKASIKKIVRKSNNTSAKSETKTSTV